MSEPRAYLVAMMGTREHYGVPRIMAHLGRLGLFATDLWSPLGGLGRSLPKTRGTLLARRVLQR